MRERGSAHIRRAYGVTGAPSPACFRTYSAASPCVAHQTLPAPLLSMCAMSCSSAMMRDRCPELCGCIVRTNVVPSSYALSNSSIQTRATSRGGLYLSLIHISEPHETPEHLV